MSYDTNLYNGSKDMNEDQWVQSKKIMTINYFLKHVQLKKSAGRIITNVLHWKIMMRLNKKKKIKRKRNMMKRK